MCPAHCGMNPEEEAVGGDGRVHESSKQSVQALDTRGL